ncbi:histidinol-phosphate transaminase [Priestia taiwanensis]|uniref:Histidinol-phosphate aminotransferase n=1 Tax=Priestia taiwanensis TaxID=1347902 RepID=A0A917EMH9_9BACI|nr:histidinol-phosphate transaminase [Priestia taiwanensis]MBM7361709.1 histidinol-phosphate aminotransferase [Priestia taiwanensis]GGE56369.1 histidinol-phosphate aminotransferase 1 [Priestia taiwanensis]
MKAKQQLSLLQAYKPGKPIDEVKRELGLEKVVKLASNENPYGCSKRVRQALYEQASLSVYPDGAGTGMKEAISTHLSVNKDEILLGSGLDEVIQIVSRALLTQEDNIVQATPTFSQYSHHAVIEGAEVREVPLYDGVHDLPAMLQAIDEHTKIVWVCNPNNPSGTYVNEQQLISFLREVPPSTLVILDEAYYEYVVATDYPQTLPLIHQYPNVMVMRTFSKAYGLAGLRIGYAVANAQLIEQLEVARLPFNTSSLAQASAVVALEDIAFVEECREKNRKELERYYDFCRKNRLFYYPSETNFILMELGISGDMAFQALLRAGYIVRSGGALGFPSMIRVSIGTAEENKGCIEQLQRLVDEAR